MSFLLFRAHSNAYDDEEDDLTIVWTWIIASKTFSNSIYSIHEAKSFNMGDLLKWVLNSKKRFNTMRKVVTI